MPGKWDNSDNATWLASAIFGSLWLVYLACDCFVRFKPTRTWYCVIAAILLNIAKIAVLVKYLEIGWFNGDWKTAGKIYEGYSILQIFIYLTSGFALYERKHKICPEKYRIDEIVFAIVFCLNIGGAIPSFMTSAAANIWDIASRLVFMGILINTAYYDLYYIYKFVSRIRGDKEPIHLSVLLPTVWTIMTAVLYLVGTEMYAFNQANFYSNAFWNLSSVIYPICAIQSNISTETLVYLKNSKSGKASASGVMSGTVSSMK
jgi:hypothetical protein